MSISPRFNPIRIIEDVASSVGHTAKDVYSGAKKQEHKHNVRMHNELLAAQGKRKRKSR